MQLSMNESWKAIQDAIKHTGENLDVDLRHSYSTPGHQGFYVEITDFTTAKRLNDITDDYYKDDHTFNLNIPYDYFKSDEIPMLDGPAGINKTDAVEVKAELRCMEAIKTAYTNWIKTHKPFSTKDLQNVINHALDKLRVLKNIDLNVRGNGNEFADKYVTIDFTWAQLFNETMFNSDKWFKVSFTLKDFYDDIGKNAVDGLIGEGLLRGKNRYDICLLRVSYLLYAEATGFLHNHWPHLYAKFLKGEF